MNRTEFLQRVHEAAAAGRAHRVHAERRAYGKYEPETRAAMFDRFEREVAAVGGRFHRLRDAAELSGLIRDLVGRQECRHALLWRTEAVARLGIYRQLDELGVEWIDADRALQLAPELRRAAMLRATLGITAVSAAVAETGSIAMQAAFGQERSASLLPAVHLAIVEAPSVVPDLFDYFQQLAENFPSELPSNVTLITGPSKTGDLELRLVTGVHGPRQWHVALVEF